MTRIGLPRSTALMMVPMPAWATMASACSTLSWNCAGLMNCEYRICRGPIAGRADLGEHVLTVRCGPPTRRRCGSCRSKGICAPTVTKIITPLP